YMLGQLRRVVTPEVNAISTVLLAISVTMVIVYFILNQRKN
ncbi:MAG TPA: spermidine/putrescine ABC transporter permease PotC, partial [Roseovarius nubinhibens]|nr:spermidine/putrescine ABC transporter permease PotC [Roseovarius nubinhibens]